MLLERILALAAEPESETLEFKRTTGTRREAAATVCAMLNHRGGHVLFGVTREGDVVGQEVSDRTMEEVSAEIQRIDPPAFPDVGRVRVAGELEVIAVSVNHGSARPYQYRGNAYRRVGNTTVTMSAEEYNRMLFERMHSEQRWENQPATGWTVEDLDVAEVRNTVAEAVRIGRLNEPGSRQPEDLLRGLGLLRDGILFRAAAVLFGKSERLELELPQCLLRVARFRGIDRSEFLDNRQFNGNAFVLLSHAERFLRETLPIASRFESGRIQRIDEPLYPPLATREAVANALCHRRLCAGRRFGGARGVRRSPRGHIDRSVAFRPDSGSAVRAARVETVEPADCTHFLSARHHRGVGTGNAQDGRAGDFLRTATARDRGTRRLCDCVLPAWTGRADAARRTQLDRTARGDSRLVGSSGRRLGTA